MPTPLADRRAFSFVELLVVIAIIAVLIALLLSAIQKVRKSAARVQCQNNLKQLGIALHSYHDNYKHFPPAVEVRMPQHCPNPWECAGTSLNILILPYLEQTGLYSGYDLERSWHDTPAYINLDYLQGSHPPPVFTCPSMSRWAPVPNRTDYFSLFGGSVVAAGGIWGEVYTDGLFGMNRSTSLTQISDGASNTLAIGERVHPVCWGAGPGYQVPGQGGPTGWWQPTWCNINCTLTDRYYGRGFGSTKNPINSSIPIQQERDNEVPYGSEHFGGANFVFADGHVRFLRDGISMTTYRALGSYGLGDIINGSEL